MQINKLATKTDPVFFDEAFVLLLETHLDYLLGHPATKWVSNEDFNALKYKGDLYGMFRNMQIPLDIHYVTMRLNGYTNSADYKGDTRLFRVPDVSEIEKLRQHYKTRKE
jgi:hypothetical protein